MPTQFDYIDIIDRIQKDNMVASRENTKSMTQDTLAEKFGARFDEIEHRIRLKVGVFKERTIRLSLNNLVKKKVLYEFVDPDGVKKYAVNWM